ncbi:ribonuclease H-like domain-containing protein [Candidatus Pacearchaeota archaeon]|nr:ribonuclease H-like domain-containing protein [Candidatus Pacearchaeota archaeon]
MKTDFIPVDYDYFDFKGRNYIKIVGRDSRGKRVCVIDSCPVYLWAILDANLRKEKIEKIIKKTEKIKLESKDRETKVEKVEVHEKNFLGEKTKALKIFATNYKDLHEIADNLKMDGIRKRRGYDLGFITHYIIEKDLLPLCWYEITGELLNNSQEFGGIDSVLEVDFCIKAANIKKIEDKDFKPRVIAYDIETDEFKIGEGEILMVSLVSNHGMKKVITWKNSLNSEKRLDYVVYVKNEAELIETFVKEVKNAKPDFLVGYFSDGFDLPYLRARAQKLKVPLSLGLNGSQPRFSRGILPIAKIDGIVHIDLLKFIRTAYSQYMQSETLSLDDVADEFLSERKKEFHFKHSSKIKSEEWESYFEYNLHDSVLTLKLAEKFWPDILEFTRIMQEPVFDISRNGMSNNVEDYILHNLSRFDEIPEKKPTHDEISERRSLEKYEGAFVFEPTPGLYENLAVFDFTSSYGSTIVTFNLSKSTLLEKPEKNSHVIEISGKKAYFSNKQGFFSQMLDEIIKKRKQYKKELKVEENAIKKARSNAFKLLANASYGYLGFFGARYYCREAAAATAAFARKSIKDSIEKIQGFGYKVIYSDTDSIAFLLGEKKEKDVFQMLDKINEQLPGIMELEVEGFYKRGIWVTKRTGNIGAKKKYALIEKNGRMKIRGFETVRRDWCNLARNVQNEILKFVLEDGNEKRALKYLKEVIEKVKKREIDKRELTIRTQLKKPMEEYKSISPHVIAARKMQEKHIPITIGNLVEYYVAEAKDKKLIRDRVKLPDEKGDYDINYYLQNQLIPAVENILQVFGVELEETFYGKKQTTLKGF